MSLLLTLLLSASAAPSDGATVSVESTKEGVEVSEVVLSTAGPDAPLLARLPRVEPRCTAPCDFDLASGMRTLQFGGGRFPIGRETLEIVPGRTAHVSVRPGSKGMKAVGATLAVTGTTVGLVGLIGMAAADNKVRFIGVAGGAVVMLCVGFPFVQAGKTKVRVRF